MFEHGASTSTRSQRPLNRTPIVETVPVWGSMIPMPRRLAATPTSPPKPDKPTGPAERPSGVRPREVVRTGDWAVQVGVFKDRVQAESVRRALAASSFDAYLVAVPTADGQTTHYKVRMGSFKTREEAGQMAERVRTLLGADVGVSTTGVAGPDPQEGKAVGTVHIAVVTPDGTGISSLELSGSREEIRAATVDRALALCLEEL